MLHNATRAGSRLVHPFDLKNYVEACTMAVNRALDRFLPPATARPDTIHKAMRYSLFAGGKRMRPALCLAAASACGGGDTPAMPLALAPETIPHLFPLHRDPSATGQPVYLPPTNPKPHA